MASDAPRLPNADATEVQPTASLRCVACDVESAQKLLFTREMMFGTREPFAYARCPHCGLLQLWDVPDDLSAHYPATYYSLAMADSPGVQSVGRGARAARDLALHAPTWVVRLVVELNALPQWFGWFAGLDLKATSRIADLGAGGARTLQQMRAWGFCDLTGIDAFIERSVDLAPGLRLVKGDVMALDRAYDLMMLNHSLEHMPEPQRVLDALARHVRPSGTILIRVPVADSDACTKYGEHWVNLDPPRHLHIFTDASMSLMAARAGLRVKRSWRDSWSLQFWGSEQYRAGIPLRDPRSRAEHPDDPAISDRTELVQRVRSKWLNARGRGDFACYALERQ